MNGSIKAVFMATGLLVLVSAFSSARAGYAETVLDDNPVVYYRFKDASMANGAAAADSSGNYRPAQYYVTAGAIAAQAGPITTDQTSTAANFTTEAQYLKATYSVLTPLSGGTTGFTYECWAKAGDNPRDGMMMSWYVPGATGALWELSYAGQGVSVYYYGEGWTPYVLANSTIKVASVNNRNTWYHIAVTTTNNTVTLYINAVAQSTSLASGTHFGPFTGTGAMWIGRRFNNTTQCYSSIAEVAVYNSALSATRIQAHYNAAFPVARKYANTVQADLPVVYYRFNDSPMTNGASAEDSSGNNRPAQYSVTAGAIAAEAGPITTDNASTAVTFTTNGQCLKATYDVLTPMNGGTTGFTYECWAKAGDNPQDGMLLSWHAPGTTGATWELSYAGDGVSVYYFGEGWNPCAYGISSVKVASVENRSKWYHLAVTTTNSTVILYVNGVPQSIGLTTAPPIGPFTGTQTLVIGRRFNDTTQCYSSLAEVAVYNSALSAMQIQAHYLAAVGGTSLVTDRFHDAGLWATNDGWTFAALNDYGTDPYDPDNIYHATRADGSPHGVSYVAPTGFVFQKVEMSYAVYSYLGADYGDLALSDAAGQPSVYSRALDHQDAAFKWYTVTAANGGPGSGNDFTKVRLAVTNGEYWSVALGTVRLEIAAKPAICVNTIKGTSDSLESLATATAGDLVQVLGYWTVGDGGGGSFYLNGTSTETADGGVVIQPASGIAGRWIRMERDSASYNVRWFGAKGDGVADDNAAIQQTIDSAVNACDAGRGLPSLALPAGEYPVHAPLTVDGQSLSWIGEHKYHSRLKGLLNGSLIQANSNTVSLSNLMLMQGDPGYTTTGVQLSNNGEGGGKVYMNLCEIRYFLGDGVRAHEISCSLIEDCDFYGPYWLGGQGWPNPAPASRTTRGVFIDAGTSWYYSTINTFRRNRFYGWKHAVEFRDGVLTTAEDNLISNNWIGLYMPKDITYTTPDRTFSGEVCLQNNWYDGNQHASYGGGYFNDVNYPTDGNRMTSGYYEWNNRRTYINGRDNCAGSYMIGVGLVRITGDANGDGVVNATDLSQVLAAMDTDDPLCDFDGDEAVTSSDLSVVLATLP